MKAALFAAAALAPLTALLASPALAETTVTGTRTTPIATATANNGAADDIRIDTGATINTGVTGPAITLNSNNTVNNSGTIRFNGINGAVGILIQGGFTGLATNNGTILITEDYSASDTDGDGDIDGVFAQGGARYGMRLVGPGAFTGNLVNATGAAITIQGIDSRGVSVESQLVGDVRNLGTISVLGDRGIGVNVAAPVSGSVVSNGTVSVTGQGSVAMAVNGAVGGAVTVQGNLQATGYRYTTRPPLPATRTALDPDDLLQGGSALQIGASVAGGVLIDAPPQDLDSANADEDADGTPDANESTGVLQVFGSAPALDIGAAAGPITLGAVGTGANAYGLVVRGIVNAQGVYDGATATGIRVGVPGGGAVNIVNGISLQPLSQVQVTAYEADAYGLRVNAGGSVPTVRNAGNISVTSTSEGVFAATAVYFDVGANVGSLVNSGTIVAQLAGERGQARAIVDRSGSLTSITNTGGINTLITATDDVLDTDDANTDPSDEVITATRTAIDLSANTTGALVRQTGVATSGTGFTDTDGDGVSDDTEPFIVGNILFGSGNDTLDVLNGAVTGDISFGAGADVLNVAGGATVTGGITDSDGQLAIGVTNGTLTVTNAATVNVTSVNVGTDGNLVFSADPRNGANTRLVASGAVNLANGAGVGLRLNSLQRTAAEYAVLTGATFNVGTLDTALLSSTPYLYMTSVRADAGTRTLYIGVRPKTAAELQLNRSETQAYGAVFNQIDADARLEAAFLGQTTRAGLVGLYDQLLPDHSGGAINSLSAVNDAISNVLDSRTDPIGRAGPNGAWAQEVFFNLRQDREQAQGYQSRGFGVTGGFEGIGTDNGAIGLTASFVTADYSDTDAAVGENVSFSMAEIGGYWRRQWGGLRFDARAAGGVVLFDSDRRVLSTANNLLLITTADWTGFSASGHVGLSYQTAGRWFVRPYGTLDAVYLYEGGYSESGGGNGVDLNVDSRSGAALFASTGVTLGARFGTDLWWGPELTLGYRGAIAGRAGDTTARFRSGTQSFTLSPEDLNSGGIQIRFALRAGTRRGYIAFETGGEVRSGYSRYDIRIVAKMYF